MEPCFVREFVGLFKMFFILFFIFIHLEYKKQGKPKLFFTLYMCINIEYRKKKFIGRKEIFRKKKKTGSCFDGASFVEHSGKHFP